MRYAAQALIGLVLTVAPAMAHQSYVDGAVSSSPSDYPGAPRQINDAPPAPYAMNYVEEAAENIGVRDGRWDMYSSNSAENRPYLPSISGTMGSSGPMLKLQWHPGE
jgi:hypothetical protein